MDEAQDYDPRANQKGRTRSAIVEAAIGLIRSGVRPTVPEAAEAAKVSRATAYRYFPTQESLLVEAAVAAPVESIERMLAERDETADPKARLLDVVDRFNAIAIDEETAMRTALHAYLDAWFTARGAGEAAPALREGRRTRWIDTALDPALAALGEKERERLRSALALTLGVEAVVVMKDVCRLGDREAQAVLRWTAEALLDAGLARTG